MAKQRPQLQDFLRSEPSNEQDLIAIDEIVLPPSQLRKYFNQDKLQQLADSITVYGVLEPLLITPQKELIAGERRLKASQLVGLTQVPVRIVDASQSEVKTIALIENLQREDLNPIEETEGILELLQLKLNQERDYVLSLLYKMNKKDDNVIISKAEIVEKTFKDLGRLTWESFVINRLRLLNLPESIFLAIKEGKIEYTKGIAIAKIKDSKIREELLETAIADNLSLKELKNRISQLKGKKSTDYSKLSTDELIQDFRQTYQKFSKNKKIWSDQKNRRKIETLLQQLTTLVND
jgi:ParB family transcriptional regulator, chromosome partitioning protein